MLHIPGTLIIEESIRALLVLFSYRFWLFVSLKPGLVLLVKTPALILERFCRKILLVSALSIIENVKQGIRIYSSIKIGVVDYSKWFLGVITRSVVFRVWPVVAWPLCIHIIG